MFGFSRKDWLLIGGFIIAVAIAGTIFFMALKQAISCDPADPLCRQGGLLRAQQTKK